MNRFRSLLFMPGNNPGMLASAENLGSDAVIFDLEDAVAQNEKDAARLLVYYALREIRPQGVTVLVRINALDTTYWREDIKAAVTGGADILLVPKVADPSHIHDVAAAAEQAEKSCGRTEPVQVLALLESTLGIENAFAIAKSHPRLWGILVGGEDLTAEMGAQRTAKGDEIQYARSRILTACKATGIRAIDTPFPFVTDLEGLEADAALAAQLGFDGKAVISPQHIHAVNAAFTPSPEKVRWATRVMTAARRAEEEGKGAVSLDGMMIDLPVIKRAERILSLAEGEAEIRNA